MRHPLFYFSAGEPSGDLHAAGLIRELKTRFPDAGFVGFGGPEMKKAGCRIEVDLTQSPVMWFLQALVRIPFFARCLKQARAFFRREKPDLLILVDYPGFNFRLAKIAKAEGIPVCFFVPPQIWAWAQGRIEKMKQYIDFVISPLPFEQKWLAAQGVETIGITHPFFEEMKTKPFDLPFMQALTNGDPAALVDPAFSGNAGSSPSAPILTLLPGSRRSEITANLPEMARTVKRVFQSVPNLRPLVAALKEEFVPLIEEILRRENLSLNIYAGKTRELIALGDCALAVSGSVSIELLSLAKPAVVYYRVGSFALWFSRFFRRVRYISLVNLLAADARGESIFYAGRRASACLTEEEQNLALYPEFLTGRDASADAAASLIAWLTNPDKLAARRRELAALRENVSAGESPFKRTADTIVRKLG